VTEHSPIRPVRRVVVLADADDVPRVVADEPSPHVHTLPGMPPDLGLTDLWYTGAGANLDDGADRDLAVAPDPGGSLFRVVQFPPDGDNEPFWHETPTCDYNVLLSGELVLLVGDQAVTLHAGDTVVVRGGKHAWSNRTDGLAILAAVSVSTADA
jgi:quercetin dioxygenase-like cupin family protein